MPRIAWIDDTEAQGELATLYETIRASGPDHTAPDIVRCLSLRPDFLAAMLQAGQLDSPRAHSPAPSTR